MDLFDDVLNFYDNNNELEIEVRVPKRYIRDIENPIQFYHGSEFLERFRFPKYIVLNVLMPMVFKIKPPNDHRELPISPIFKMLTALRFYATGCCQKVNGDLQGLSQPTISRIVKYISSAICLSLKTWVNFPNENKIPEIKEQFYKIAKFPGVTMVIDCTHIPISSPGGDNAEICRNRKNWMSLNVQLIAGPQLQIFDVVARWPGSAHDLRIFENSRAWSIITHCYTNGKCLADGGYAQTKNVFTPHPNPQTEEEKRYQKAHISTRNVIERVNGVLKSRFRCLTWKLGTELHTTTKIIVSCVILHNICIHYKLHTEVEDHPIQNQQIPHHNINENNIRGSDIRNQFIIQHFS